MRWNTLEAKRTLPTLKKEGCVWILVEGDSSANNYLAASFTKYFIKLLVNTYKIGEAGGN